MEQILADGSVITLVHFVSMATVPPRDDEPEGPPVQRWQIACMPNMVEFHQTPYHPNYQRTNDPRAVSCSACKASSVFKRMMEPYRG